VSHSQPIDPHHLPQLEPLDDPEPGSTWFVSLAGVIILVALVIAISAVNFNTERDEFATKVVERSVDVAAMAPKAPVDAEAFRDLERSLAESHDDGSLGMADYTRLSQGLLLNTWMRYPWEDSKGTTQQLIRIPITEAMRRVAEEYAAKAPARPMAAQEGSAP